MEKAPKKSWNRSVIHFKKNMRKNIIHNNEK